MMIEGLPLSIKMAVCLNLWDCKAALHEIEDERLVDCVAKFDGKDSSQVLTLNQTWLGRDCQFIIWKLWNVLAHECSASHP